MDKRTGFRRRGHAYHAEEARRALGLTSEFHGLADLPLPIVHAGLGVAACGIAVALRPGAVGVKASVIGVGILALLTGVVLAGYDRVVYPAGRRPTVEGLALPVAALVAFSLVLGGTLQFGARLAAGTVAVIVIAGVPHLGGLRATGRESFRTRILRDAAGVAVLVPIFLAGVSDKLPLPLRLGLVGIGVALVTLDGLLTEAMRRRHSAAVAAAVALVTVAVVAALSALNGGAGTRAAVALVVWYGARGFGQNLLVRPRRVAPLVEYAVVVVVVLGVLRLLAFGR